MGGAIKGIRLLLPQDSEESRIAQLDGGYLEYKFGADQVQVVPT